MVRAAKTAEGTDVGLIMLKSLSTGQGYVYYVAVPHRFRRQGIGGKLLDEGLAYFKQLGAGEVYASVEGDNEESRALFASRGFERVKGSEMAEKYGRLRTLLLYREMTVAPGEMLLEKRL